MNTLHFRLALLASLGAAGIGLWLALSGQSESGADATAASGAAAIQAGTATSARHASPAASAPTTVEEAARLLELGVSGDLTVDMNTRGALDVLLASLGPDATPADFQRLEEALRRSMPGEAATQAIALVRRYDGYQRAAARQEAVQQPPGTPEELEALLKETMALRREHFDEATARALFGAEEEQTRLDMAMNAVQADPRLSPEEKATRLAALREQSPRDLPGLQVQAPPPLGEEAALAKTEMEAQRAQWESRYQAYLQQKKTIVAAAAPDMAAQLDSALRRHFKEEELAAALAYDRRQAP